MTCGNEKLVNELMRGNPTQTSPAQQKREESKVKHFSAYSREADLRERLNSSLSSALSLAGDDYYEKLNLDRLMLLKQCLSRVHDVITLKLTYAAMNWVVDRMALTPEQKSLLHTQVDRQHPNAAGFDLDLADPNLVAEVKGNIPVHRMSRFGSAQDRGLTNDVLQMLGRPPIGKEIGKMKDNNKVKRQRLDSALKLLFLCDVPEVRVAAAIWKRNLMTRSLWRQMDGHSIQEFPTDGPLSPQVVYLVYLTPLH